MAAVESLSFSSFDNWESLITSISPQTLDIFVGSIAEDGGEPLLTQNNQLLDRSPSMSEQLLDWMPLPATDTRSLQKILPSGLESSSQLNTDYFQLMKELVGQQPTTSMAQASLIQYLLVDCVTGISVMSKDESAISELIHSSSYQSYYRESWDTIVNSSEDLETLVSQNLDLIHSSIGVAARFLTGAISPNESVGEYTRSSVKAVTVFLNDLFASNDLDDLYSPEIVEAAVGEYLELIRPYNNQIRSHILNSR